MFEHIEKIELASILHGISVRQGAFYDRPSHAFIFKRIGQSRYNFENNSILLSEGEVLFVPKGSTYTVTKTCPEESRYVLINFQAELKQARPGKFLLAGRMDFAHFCNRLCACATPQTDAEKWRAVALMYEALAYISEAENIPYSSSDAMGKLEPALEWLRERIFDPELSVGSLHTLCGLSDTWFRKLFKTRFGASPGQYVLNKRLSHAKAILESGEYNSVAEVALLSGFSDPLYFSKAFRSRYGHPPSRAGK